MAGKGRANRRNRRRGGNKARKADKKTAPLTLTNEERLELVALKRQHLQFNAEVGMFEMKLQASVNNRQISENALSQFGAAFKQRYGVDLVTFDDRTGIVKGADGKPYMMDGKKSQRLRVQAAPEGSAAAPDGGAGAPTAIMCSKCTAEIVPGVKFCPDCGDEVVADDSPEALVDECSECGAVVGADQKFCAECGASMIFTCPKCNAEVDDDEAEFCPECGVKFDDESSDAAPEAAPEAPKGFVECACGVKVRQDKKFCPKCGSKVVLGAAVDAPTTPEPVEAPEADAANDGGDAAP